MGNRAGIGELIDTVINESTKLCELDKTKSTWQTTMLMKSKDEGLFVFKQLLKCETNQFDKLRDKL